VNGLKIHYKRVLKQLKFNQNLHKTIQGRERHGWKPRLKDGVLQWNDKGKKTRWITWNRHFLSLNIGFLTYIKILLNYTTIKNLRPECMQKIGQTCLIEGRTDMENTVTPPHDSVIQFIQSAFKWFVHYFACMNIFSPIPWLKFLKTKLCWKSTLSTWRNMGNIWYQNS